MSDKRIMGRLVGGRLTDMRVYRPGEQNDPALVPLAGFPDSPGPYTYDAETRRAVSAPLDADERLARVDLPRRLLAALTLRAWPDATAAERAWAAGVIANAGQRIREARQ